MAKNCKKLGVKKVSTIITENDVYSTIECFINDGTMREKIVSLEFKSFPSIKFVSFINGVV